MTLPVPVATDRRGKLPELACMQYWVDLPSGYKVGLRHSGEFRMGAEAGNVLIADKSGQEWINLGQYRFYFPNWIVGGIEPEGLSDPVSFSPDGTYVVLNWLYAHLHSAMSPVLIHLPTKAYLLMEPHRILTAKGVANEPVILCQEFVWKDSQRSDRIVQISPSKELRPLSEFYELDPFEIETDVYSWKEGVLHVEPLKNLRMPSSPSEKDNEEIKRDRCCSPVERWRHIQEILDWVKSLSRK